MRPIRPTPTGVARAALAALSVLAVLGLAACGDDVAGNSAGTTGPPGDAFPVTIEHKYGTTEIVAEPQRVLSLGFQEHDTILALGVTPIAARYWYGDKDDVILPWAEEAAGGATPEILDMPYGELNLERIAALEPDLILGVYSGITRNEYERLSRIAPTVAQSADYVDFGVPWQDMTRTAGRALGRPDRAEELIADLEARFAAVREAHPGWEGRSAVVATYRGDGFAAFASDDPRARFFRSLGFRIPAQIDELAGDSFFVDLSLERARLLDQDLLIWDQLQFVDGGRSTIEELPLVRELAVTRQGRSIFLEGVLEEAFGWNTVLSLPFALEGIERLIEGSRLEEG